MGDEKGRFFWKGKRVTEKLYQQRVAQQKSGMRRKKVKSPVNNPTSTSTSNVHGRRIVEISNLAKNMKCTECKGLLDLQLIQREERYALGSIFHIPCNDCQIINLVPTDKMHMGPNNPTRSRRFDVNSKTALGALHSGLGATHINKLLAALNIPTVDSKTFKKYENEMGTAVEEVAKESCHEWAKIERQETIENSEKLMNVLPPSVPSNFVLPELGSRVKVAEKSSEAHVSADVEAPKEKPSEASVSADIEAPKPKPSEAHVSADIEAPKEKPSEARVSADVEATKENYNGLVRIAASYDMGYSTKGSGRSYDSLNGYGALLGRETGKVIDYFTTNRSCKKCSIGHSSSDHDCRMNFAGSAKAMEPFAATQLTSNSAVLKDLNLSVGVLIGDDDSATISAVRAVSQSQVVKLSDKNHTSRGVSNAIYKIAKEHKELCAKSIRYLHDCFTYALSQNVGHSKEMADAIKNIPKHAFNDHTYCGDWCGYKKDPKNYRHQRIGAGFQSQSLFNALNNVFCKLADNVDRFAAGASSQGNESLNAAMTSHYPKSRCYSQSASGDFRFACTIGGKNLGEEYMQKAAKKRLLSPGINTTNYIEKRTAVAKRRYSNSNRPQVKRRRLFLREERNNLRNKKENREGTLYESHMGLLTTNAVQNNTLDVDSHYEVVAAPSDNETPSSEAIVVFFDLETAGFSKHSDILQIAAQHKKSSFSVYINPVQKIAQQASQATGLTNVNGELMLNGNRVPSIPLRLAFDAFLQFLIKLNHPVVLTAHNCNFDSAILITSIKEMSMIDDFESVVVGFADTLALIKSITGRKGRGECTLGGLASWLQISTEGAHNAIHDVDMMIQITQRLNITTDQIIDRQKTWKETKDNVIYADRANEVMKTLLPLKDSLSVAMRKKLAAANINFNDLIETFRTDGDDGIKKLLGNDENGKVRVSTSKRVIEKFLDCLKVI